MEGADTPVPSSTVTLNTSLSGDQSTTSVPAPISKTITSLDSAGEDAGVCDVDQEMETLRTAISAINKLRPRFVVVTGSFTHAYPSNASSSPSSPSSSSPSSSTATTAATASPASTSTSSAATTLPKSSKSASTSTSASAIDTQRDFQLNQFMRTMARVSETIPLLFVPGDRDVGECIQLL